MTSSTTTPLAIPTQHQQSITKLGPYAFLGLLDLFCILLDSCLEAQDWSSALLLRMLATNFACYGHSIKLNSYSQFPQDTISTTLTTKSAMLSWIGNTNYFQPQQQQPQHQFIPQQSPTFGGSGSESHNDSYAPNSKLQPMSRVLEDQTLSPSLNNNNSHSPASTTVGLQPPPVVTIPASSQVPKSKRQSIFGSFFTSKTDSNTNTPAQSHLPTVQPSKQSQNLSKDLSQQQQSTTLSTPSIPQSTGPRDFGSGKNQSTFSLLSGNVGGNNPTSNNNNNNNNNGTSRDPASPTANTPNLITPSNSVNNNNNNNQQQQRRLSNSRLPTYSSTLVVPPKKTQFWTTIPYVDIYQLPSSRYEAVLSDLLLADIYQPVLQFSSLTDKVSTSIHSIITHQIMKKAILQSSQSQLLQPSKQLSLPGITPSVSTAPATTSTSTLHQSNSADSAANTNSSSTTTTVTMVSHYVPNLPLVSVQTFG
jgi:hypothetical protein